MRLRPLFVSAAALALLLAACSPAEPGNGTVETMTTPSTAEASPVSPSTPSVSIGAETSFEDTSEGDSTRQTPVKTKAEAIQYLVGTYQFDLALEERAAFMEWAKEQDQVNRIEQAKSDGKTRDETPEELAESDRVGFSAEELKILADRDRQCKNAQIILRADHSATVRDVWPCRDLWRIDPDATDWNVIRVQADGTIQVRLGKSRFRVTEHKAITPEMKRFENPNRRIFAGNRFLKIG